MVLSAISDYTGDMRLRLSRDSLVKLLLLGIVVFGIGLRFLSLSTFTGDKETADEIFWTTLGASLLTEGKPTGWSWFKAYDDRTDITIMEYQLPYREINLDHPPLFALIPGGIQALSGQDWRDLDSLHNQRVAMIVLASISLSLFALITNKLFSPTFAVVTTALYATIPTVVLSSQLIVAEQLVTGLSLALIAVGLYVQGRVRWFLLMFLSASLVMTKIGAIALIVGYAASFWDRPKGRQDLLSLIVGTVFGCILLGGYVSYFDWDLFWRVQLQQKSWRHPGLLTIPYQTLIKPELIQTFFADGFLPIGILSLAAVASRRVTTRFKPILCMVGAYLVFLLAAVGETTFEISTMVGSSSVYGWYIYPLFPLLTLIIGWAIEKTYKTKAWFYLIVLSFFWLFPIIRLAWYHSTQSASIRVVFPNTIVTFLAIEAMLFLIFRHRLRLALTWTIIIALVVLNTVVVINFNQEVYKQDQEYWKLLSY